MDGPATEGDGRFQIGLERRVANYTPLSPLSFLARAALVFPGRTSIVHGDLRWTWRETYARCRRLASALAARGVRRGDVVAVLAPNVPAMVEAHFGVPMAGAILNTLNTRLDAASVAFMLRHGGARVLLVDGELAPVARAALEQLDTPILVVDLDDPLGPPDTRIGALTYEALLAEGDPDHAWEGPPDEWDAISLNYTSGTTGDPKGVVIAHRSAYLNAVSNVVCWSMPAHPTYLWTLPLFHCNGWCFPWTVALLAGVNVCLRRVDAAPILDAIRRHRVTHMCGAPIVYANVVAAPEEMRVGIDHTVQGMVAGAAPPAALIEGAERIGIHLTHVYGLTEVLGPAAVCAPQAEWADLPLEARAEKLARQGVTYPLQEAMEVRDPATLAPVPWDGATMGEIVFRGNITMRGYLSNPDASARAFEGGWFHTGDLAVVDPDGYVRIRDRSKDIIISGGENIASLEVEEALHRHASVFGAAVVAQPDPKWGETPCAFIELKPGHAADADALRAHCRAQLAHYKVPKRFVFGPLPRTSTGKIQKHVLREAAKETDR
ncbi:acyl-CoA synthetase [Acidisphaera rubrifaciens]|uniref:3-methylmercaptopropionyl-CoA ligase n=1 Tax=Acidisphaera rubrifaciens HS-AP3 TaxID=1231350 RepID=A0A0D6P5D6_9PROT|nr:acyl-CoA synthetase [Acidisphaera rubrifaciens]GAN76867.1 fatty-acid--CoA ligase [Acidisphaera rubrifaciens HS-AP3]